MQRLRQQRPDALTRYGDAKTATTASGDADAALAISEKCGVAGEWRFTAR
jgi:hypothetical protein